ncbi:hypothetical protein TNCV_2022851 [Trichonephila clavipes]|uniref:Uncharacterized protein n=1 Tax=Trichonephila inaurata madagascariensis TaxID=2747483 RepID=A0A8X6XMU3_9ARAC|nr:hypothetical protein TNCV_2022851 [Trichonephila clavipes]GFY56600.1 hypothetical protein TNIN_110711 [Trichonephila inaurata madagascariensis]
MRSNRFACGSKPCQKCLLTISIQRTILLLTSWTAFTQDSIEKYLFDNQLSIRKKNLQIKDSCSVETKVSRIQVALLASTKTLSGKDKFANRKAPLMQSHSASQLITPCKQSHCQQHQHVSEMFQKALEKSDRFLDRCQQHG